MCWLAADPSRSSRAGAPGTVGPLDPPVNTKWWVQSTHPTLSLAYARGSDWRAMLACCASAVFMISGCASSSRDIFPALERPIVWPPPPDAPRIQYVGTLSNSDDLHSAKSGVEIVGDILHGSRPSVSFTGPQSIALGPGSLLAVADGAGACVHVVDLDRRTHALIAGWGDERFGVPFGVAWVENRLFATDASRHEVIELDATGRMIRTFGVDLLARPVGIAFVPPRNQLFVVDGGAHSVKVFDLAGRLVTQWGRRGDGSGEFNFPTHIAWSGDSIAVADSGNFRVQILNLDGRHQRTIGQKGNAAGDFSLPKGVAFDHRDFLYVVDAQFENVQIFDGQGRLLLAFGEEGSDPGRFSLPAGLAIGRDRRIWIADSGNHRLQVFSLLENPS